MPGELKRLLSDEVRRSGRSLNDVAVGILASRFAVSFDPSGRAGKDPGKSGSVLLRMPPELKDKLAARAAQRKRNVNDLIVETLSERLGGKEPMASTNGKARRGDSKVRVAIIGVGNCASSLVQGVEYYKDANPDDFVPGLMHVDLGGYHISDIEFTAAFDVTTDKVGKDLSEAIWAHPNNTIKFSDVPKSGITVSRGMTHDGLGKYLSEIVEKAPGETADVVGILKDTNTDVVINYLPVGSEEATKWYTEQILSAGCAMVNCMPVFIARENYWQRRFEEAGVPIIGDDIKSQVGATITHRVLMSIFRDRGVQVDRTFQLNFGGNSDFLNMLERDRLESKKISKTYAIQSTVPYEIEAKNIHVGPSDHVPWLEDRKWAYIRLEGTSFGDVPLNAELKIEVWDSPNSAGVVIDAVRHGEARPQQRRLGHARRAELLPDEVAAGPARGRRGARPDGGVHPQARAQARGEGGRQGLARARAGLDSPDMGLRVCLVTPFAWSRPHDVNEHVAGVAHELRGLGHDVTVLAPSTRAADLIAGRRALLDGGGARADRARAGPAGLAAQPDRRSGRRADEPLARPGARRVRRRARLRARPAEPLVPRATRLARLRGRDVPLARAARLPAGQGAARAAARPHRRARRHLGGDRGGRGRAPARATTA